MRKTALVLFSVAAGLTLLLLFTNVHMAQTADTVDSSQTISSAKAGIGAVGTTLRVYLAGDVKLSGAIRDQITRALRAKELPFDEITLVDELPPDAIADPLLAIRIDRDGGLWTPFYASRTVEATLIYLQGRPVDSGAILSGQPEGQSVNFTECRGECSEGWRQVDLEATSAGLVGLPYIRSFAAGKVAEEAATLVAEGLPERLNPSKWSSRAHALAREKVSAPDGVSSSFVKQAGCRGGLVAMSTSGGGLEWRTMYYDAAQDAITETLSRSDWEARIPGVRLFTPPGVSSSEKGTSIYLGGSTVVTIPPGVCGFEGWQIASQ